MIRTCTKCGNQVFGVMIGRPRCSKCGADAFRVEPCVTGHPGEMGMPGADKVREIMEPAHFDAGSVIGSSEAWDQIDEMARIRCCHATAGEQCQGHHAQGTRVVYGYESLAKGVQRAVLVARNGAVDEAISKVSELSPLEGAALKSKVLEILSSLKTRTV